VALLREPGARYAPARSSALGLKAIVLAGLAIGVMVVDHRQQHLKVIREGLTAAAYPFQVAVHSPVAGWEWLTSNFATRNTLLAENRALKSRQWRDELRVMRFEAVEQENLRLRKLVAAAPRAGERVMLANILRVDLDPFRHRVILDRGSNEGVFKGQAVVDGDGVFGQVTNVGPYSAEVILLSDSSHAIPVQISRNGLRTIAVGTGEARPGENRRLQLPYLPRNADVKKDDVLLTSGLGGVFPGGYPVGRVVEVKRDPSQPLAIVNAEPSAALDRDNEVLLVWFTERKPDVPPAPPPGTAPKADAKPADKAAKPVDKPAKPTEKPGTTTKPADSRPANGSTAATTAAKPATATKPQTPAPKPAAPTRSGTTPERAR
jgi:rod shape-determining protein MreC